MQRTIIRILPNRPSNEKERPGRFFLESPRLQDSGLIEDLGSHPDEEPFKNLQDPVPPEAVKLCGSTLLEDLRKQKAFPNALAALYANPAPIYIWLQDEPLAERLPWETLYDPSPDRRFLSLTSAWPIVRLRTPQRGDPVEQVLTPPLRVLSVLSAAGDPGKLVNGKPEWSALWKALTQMAAQPNALPVRLKVLVGEDELMQQIKGEPQVQGIQLEAEFVSAKEQVTTAIKSFGPRLLHFFCHGSTSGMPHLQVGTRNDWIAQREGSVTLTATDLRDDGDPSFNVWLVTLNCCESAAMAADARNLASSLVGAGFPAAIGMRESIQSLHAHAITERLYTGVLEQLGKLVENQPEVIEWGKVVSAVRRHLLSKLDNRPPEMSASDFREWTIPVVYASLEPLRVKRAAPAPTLSPEEMMGLLEQAKLLQEQLLKAQTMTAPETVKQKVITGLQKKIQEIEAKFV